MLNIIHRAICDKPSVMLAALQSELHVWIADPLTINPQQLVAQYFPLLDADEREHYQRFHFERDRLHYLAAHALLRVALSHYTHYKPAQWRFIQVAYGKPEIAMTSDLPPLSHKLSFNLSHTQGLVACVIANDFPCGIDVEEIRPMQEMRSVAEMVFSNAEIAFLEAQDEATLPRNFFALWTLKEAYIKATGLGFSAPLKQISFSVNMPQPSVDFHADLKEDPAQWLFHQHKPTASHQLAVAARPSGVIETIAYHLFDLSRACIVSERSIE